MRATVPLSAGVALFIAVQPVAAQNATPNATQNSKASDQTTAKPAQSGKASTADSATPGKAADSPSEVVIKGVRPEVSDRIDRRVYDIKNDPDAQTGIAADVLNRLPSVQVSPTGKVTLRGDAGVTVLVDGKYPANGNGVVQNLSAADIDRIEVMTNPSAQYAPDGASGIINIITRKRHPLGLTGSFYVRTSTLGMANTGVSAVFTNGPWSIDSRLSFVHSPYTGRSRDTQTLPIMSEGDGEWTGGFENVIGNLNIAYKLSDTRTLTLQAQDFRGHSKSVARGSYRSAARTYDNLGGSSFDFGQNDIEVIYDDNNEKTGAHFTLDLDHTQFDSPSLMNETDTYSPIKAAIYGQAGRSWGPEDYIKGDYERHFTSGNELTAGFQWDRHITNVDKAYFDLGSLAGPVANGFRHGFVADQALSSAYVTYQMPIGKWTILPGLRVEWQRLGLVSDGLHANADVLQWYPSLHLSHDAGEGAKIKLSYSRRVQRPGVEQYDPGISYVGVTSKGIGNPDLRPEDTDSLEAEYAYAHKDVSYEASVYYRATRNLLADLSYVDSNGIIVTMPVNGGRSRSGGVEVTLKAPLWPQWKYSFNGNLYDNQVPQTGGGTRSALAFTGNEMLEYDSKGGDQYQLNLTLNSRVLSSQGYVTGSYRLDASWQRPLNKKWSVVVSATDVFDSQHSTYVIDTPTVKSRSISIPSIRSVRVGLSYKFGLAKKP